MARNGGILNRLIHRQSVRRWADLAARVGALNSDELRKTHDAAQSLKASVDQVLHRTGERLAMPMGGHQNFPRPDNSDWAWRPGLWRGPLGLQGRASLPKRVQLGSEITLYHDCALSEMTVRQNPNLRDADLAPYGLTLDVLGFSGSFLSIVVELPKDATDGLKRSHVIRLDAVIDLERSLDMFARLNVQHGPNTEQMPQEVTLDGDRGAVEFDLAYSNLNEKRVEKAWIDIIFEGPAMNRICLRDVTLSRRPRAAL